MKINRIYNNLEDYIQPGKALLIFGPRQVGKTTLVKDFMSNSKYRFKYITGDDISMQALFSSQHLQEIRTFCEGYDILVIDEAQRIPEIGNSIKLIVDNIPQLTVIATGSSSFELAGQTGEPLVGRKTTLLLHTIAQIELNKHMNKHDLKEKLNEYLVFGSYPEVLTSETIDAKRNILMEIANSYLYKDILSFERIRNPYLLIDLLRLLAYQIGSEISINELSGKLGIDNKTVKKYIELLEKSYVILELRGYSNNLRNEITKKPKYYFYDNGIRNAIIANFNPIQIRNDTGQLWENFLVMERLKKQTYYKIYANNFFWRTWNRKEIDYIEEREGKLFGYEFKWNMFKRQQPPVLWTESYPGASYQVINPDNYLDFIL